VSFDPFASDGQVFPLRGDRRPVVLQSDGVEHPSKASGHRRVLTRYADITHLATTSHAAWIGTKRSVYVIGRGAFAQTGGPEYLVQALMRRIAEQPGGREQLARMAAIDRVGLAGQPLRATWTLFGICIAFFVAQLWIGHDVEAVANFTPAFFYDGDLWRVVTANFVHAAPRFPLHLGLNMLALLVLGALVERPLGVARTATIMGVSGVAAMLTSALAGGFPVVGASGIVFGLVGAAVWLEFTWAERLPAWWRYPRRSLLFLLVLNGALSFLVPLISGSAHLGGFLAGLATAAVVARSSSPFEGTPRWAFASIAAVVLLTGMSVGSAALELTRPGEYAARQAARLATLPGVSAEQLNDSAWLIAISPEPSREMMEAALVLAERAVAETDRTDPTILDTLAEVEFALGWPERAIRTIDQAIRLDPDEPYYREQRRRFTGERAPDDRPPSPLPLWLRVPQTVPEPAVEETEPGLSI